MQIIVTHSRLTRPQVLNVPTLGLLAGVVFGGLSLLLLVAAAYHFVLLKGAREGWPVVSQMLAPFSRAEFAQRDRLLRENLDAMAGRLGELQAKLVKLDAIGERVSGMAGLKQNDFSGLGRQGSAERAAKAPEPLPVPAKGGQGGPFVPMASPSLGDLEHSLGELDLQVDRSADVFTLIESRLLEARLLALMVPSSPPVDGPVASGFGFRIDPFSGLHALHTGLDFPASPGTPIKAAAGGLVLSAEVHPAYGRLIELDHGNGLITRYAHASKLLVHAGDLVKRGQQIAEVGSSGRSTGPHLHFEVLVDGVPQDPVKFLARGSGLPGTAVAAAERSRRRP